MSHHRLFVSQALNQHQQIILDAEQAHYLRTVMRLAVGDLITLFNGDGMEYQAQLQCLHKAEAVCLIQKHKQIHTELGIDVHIVQCANRSDRIETVLQKATEMGMASIQVSNSERTTLKLNPKKLEQRLERWQKIIIEASEQSQRVVVPTVHWCPKISQIKIHGTAFILHPDATTQHWKQFQQCVHYQKPITLLIGPEGGWSCKDLAELEKKGAQPLSFGQRVMRTETAAPALLAAVQTLLLCSN